MVYQCRDLYWKAGNRALKAVPSILTPQTKCTKAGATPDYSNSHLLSNLLLLMPQRVRLYTLFSVNMIYMSEIPEGQLALESVPARDFASSAALVSSRLKSGVLKAPVTLLGGHVFEVGCAIIVVL